jgi:hypothetical protein
MLSLSKHRKGQPVSVRHAERSRDIAEPVSFWQCLHFASSYLVATVDMTGTIVIFSPNGLDFHNRRSSTCGYTTKHLLPARQDFKQPKVLQTMTCLLRITLTGFKTLLGFGVFAGHPPNSRGSPPNSWGLPPSFQGVPYNWRGNPPNLRRYPRSFPGRPTNFAGTPANFQGRPAKVQGAPVYMRDAPQVSREVPQKFRGVPQNLREAPKGWCNTSHWKQKTRTNSALRRDRFVQVV